LVVVCHEPQVIAFDQFCANVQRDVHSVLAMHHVNSLSGPNGGCKGNAPIIAGLNIPMNETQREKGASEKPTELESTSVPTEAVITITADSASSAELTAASAGMRGSTTSDPADQ
jgi:hypothetical protein